MVSTGFNARRTSRFCPKAAFYCAMPAKVYAPLPTPPHPRFTPPVALASFSTILTP